LAAVAEKLEIQSFACISSSTTRQIPVACPPPFMSVYVLPLIICVTLLTSCCDLTYVVVKVSVLKIKKLYFYY